MPKVLVSIVTHNESHDVERLLPSLIAQSYRNLAIHATDNASEDGTRSVLTTFQRQDARPMTVLASRENLGYTGGHNKAVEAACLAGAEWILILNADVVLAADFVERLMEEAEHPRSAGVASLTGKILRAEGAELLPTDILDTVGLRMTRSGRHFDIGSGERDVGQYSRPAEVFGVSGCAALYRLSALRDVQISTGYFDDDFFLYREDVDLAWRLRGRGYTSRYVPSAGAWHRRRNLPERRRQMSEVANLHSVKNRFLLRINNAGEEHIRATFPRTFARDLLVIGGCLTIERSSLAALRWLARERERLLEKRYAIRARRTVPDKDLLRWFGSDAQGARIPVV